MLRTILAVVLPESCRDLTGESCILRGKKEDGANPPGAAWRRARTSAQVRRGRKEAKPRQDRNGDQTWPKYWSACNKRLKAQNA